DTATGDLTFSENGTTPTQWDSVAAFRGVSEGDVTRFAISKREPLLVEQETFRDAVLGQQTDVVTMAEGLRTLAVAEAILRSAQAGEPVALGGAACRSRRCAPAAPRRCAARRRRCRTGRRLSPAGAGARRPRRSRPGRRARSTRGRRSRSTRS